MLQYNFSNANTSRLDISLNRSKLQNQSVSMKGFFSTEERFPNNINNFPGPQDYQNPLNFSQIKKNKNISKSRRFQEYSVIKAPPPGTYDYHITDSRRIPIKLARIETKRRGPKSEQILPGPTSYNPVLTKYDHKNSSFFQSDSKRILLPIQEGPDPASYQIYGDIDKKVMKMKGNLIKQQNYQIFKAQQQHEENNGIIFYQKQLKKCELIQDQFQSPKIKQRNNSTSINNSSIPKLKTSQNQVKQKELSLPGPGQYQLYKQPYQQKSMVTGSVFRSETQKLDYIPKKFDAGPGSYQISQSILKKKFNINLHQVWS